VTSTEIAITIIAALFALYGLAMSFGCFYDRRGFGRRIAEADKRAATAQENSGYFSRKVAHLAERLHQIDQGIGRAIHHIIDLHSEEHSLRLATDPESYLPDAGKQHEFIARGLLRALNIVEEETGRYKEEEEEPSPAYVAAKERYGAKCVVCGGRATTHRWGQLQVELVPVPYRAKVTVRLGKYDYWQTMKPLNLCQTDADVLDKTPGGMVVFYVGAVACTHEEQKAANRKQELARRQSQEADRQRRQFVADQRRAQFQFTNCHFRPPCPYHPPTGECAVCGTPATTYRWGQATTTMTSANYKRVTRATIEVDKFDRAYSVGWLEVCSHHARVLDKHGTVNRRTLGRIRRTGGTPRMGGYTCG